MDNSQAVVECPRAERAKSPRAEGANRPRAEGAETADAEDGEPQLCDTGQIMNGCLIEEEMRRREEEEEEEEEMKKVLPHEDGPIPRPPWIWRKVASNMMRAWFWQWGRM